MPMSLPACKCFGLSTIVGVPLSLLSILVAYLIGGLPFGYWVVRLRSGQDIRNVGSGNTGATNVQRTLGTKAGLVVLALDILKGAVAVFLADRLFACDSTAVALTAFAVLLGHCFPIFLKFKGGKAVACFIGVFLYLAPLAFLIITVLFVATVAISRHISLGSILGAAAFPFVYWFVNHPPVPLFISAVACGCLIIYRHSANIDRLRKGEERVFSFKTSRA